MVFFQQRENKKQVLNIQYNGSLNFLSPKMLNKVKTNKQKMKQNYDYGFFFCQAYNIIMSIALTGKKKYHWILAYTFSRWTTITSINIKEAKNHIYSCF